MAAIDRLVEQFAVRLQTTQADRDAIRVAFCDIIAYAMQYIALDYHSVWWRLFHVLNSAEWANVLVLAELLFPSQH